MILRLVPALALVASAFAPAFAAPARDWSRTVALSPIGGHVLGNPRAKDRLVEYVSYTCIHCAAFVNSASKPLKAGWVKRGGLSVEVRNAVRDPFDLTAALLARCGGKDRFFGNHEALFANYDAWMKQIQAYDASGRREQQVDNAAMIQDIAAQTGLTALMGKRGYSPAKVKACLADTASRDRILAMTKDAWETRKIGGTPGFVLNDTLLTGPHDWPKLQAALPAQTK